MIEIRNLEKTYAGRSFEVKALRGVDLSVGKGEYLSVIGKSGSGKSSLLKILGLLDFDYEGEYRFFDVSYRDADDRTVSAARRRVGYVFQDFQLIARHSVRRNLELAAVIRGGQLRGDEVEHALERVGLIDKVTSYPDELSGGQKQRVAIARALLGKPDLLIADEPTGSLDSATASGVMELIGEIAQEQGCSVIVVTHDLEVAERASRTIELVDGHLGHEVFR